jgi:hypothetical protein
MPNGPTLIFDKSTLQSLNPDEAVWLDAFFITNITPLFYVETLADLEKAARGGRTPEEIVGSLAYKTPDAASYPNVHHETLVAGELTGQGRITMDGRPVLSGGVELELDGETGLLIRQTPEQEAFRRWQRREFLDLERSIAKRWRRQLSNVDFSRVCAFVRSLLDQGRLPKTVDEAKRIADDLLDDPRPAWALRLGMTLLGISPEAQDSVVARWNATGQPTIRDFAPFFSRVVAVDLFFYVAMSTGLIASTRPSHKIDIAYLYYLPFCKIFTSTDKLHGLVTRLFLDAEQRFIPGNELKADLRRLDEHYTALPDAIKEQGLYRFAPHPPPDTSFLVTQLWDRYLPSWRKNATLEAAALQTPEMSDLAKDTLRFAKEGRPVTPPTARPSDQYRQMVVERSVYPKKGKWRRVPVDIDAPSKKG